MSRKITVDADKLLEIAAMLKTNSSKPVRDAAKMIRVMAMQEKNEPRWVFFDGNTVSFLYGPIEGAVKGEMRTKIESGKPVLAVWEAEE